MQPNRFLRSFATRKCLIRQVGVVFQLVSSLFAVPQLCPLWARDVRAEVENHDAFILDLAERDRKLKAMCLTPFTFYRATAYLFYKDIAEHRLQIPAEWDSRSGLRTWISGDFHLQNVGFEDPAGGQYCFELNDFDEACEAPFYWDLIRLVASVYLAKDSKNWPLETKDDKKEQMGFSLSDTGADEVTTRFLKTYQETVAANTIASLTAQELGEPTDRGKAKATEGFVKDQLSPKEKKVQEKCDEFWKKETGGTKVRFNMEDKERFAELDHGLQTQIKKHWNEYVQTVRADFATTVRPDYFKPIHMAQRLGSGLGSLGVVKVYILVEGPSETAADDNIVLEAKASGVPAEVEAGALPVSLTIGEDGKRVSDATRAMTARTDNHEGWFNTNGVSYHVTRISPLADGVKLKDFEMREQLEDYLQWSAVALANAHCRSNPHFAAEALSAFDDFRNVKETILNIGRAYARQVEADYHEFCQR
jgi:uncharacterized protein (DUF2252 family)